MARYSKRKSSINQIDLNSEDTMVVATLGAGISIA